MKKICVTGYFASGSSACLDYLSEFSSTSFLKGRADYEHSLFYVGDGLFELYDRLYSDRSNYLSRSHALNNFYDMAMCQYNTNFGWFGSYKKLLGNTFAESLDMFMNTISTKQGQGCDIADYKGVYYSPIKALAQICYKLVFGYKITVLGRQYKRKKRPFRYITVDREGFIEATKKFIAEYSELCNKDGKGTVVFDHLLTAEQVCGVSTLLPDDFSCIIVDRNPIDMYLISKYVWSSKKHGGYTAPVPMDPIEFCNNYKLQHRDLDFIQNTENILYIQFEDLVLDTEHICDKINKFCGLKKEEHIKQNAFFNPQKSIVNIGIASRFPEETDNINIIKELLPEYCKNYVQYESLSNNNSEIF